MVLADAEMTRRGADGEVSASRAAGQAKPELKPAGTGGTPGMAKLGALGKARAAVKAAGTLVRGGPTGPGGRALGAASKPVAVKPASGGARGGVAKGGQGKVVKGKGATALPDAGKAATAGRGAAKTAAAKTAAAKTAVAKTAVAKPVVVKPAATKAPATKAAATKPGPGSSPAKPRQAHAKVTETGAASPPPASRQAVAKRDGAMKPVLPKAPAPGKDGKAAKRPGRLPGGRREPVTAAQDGRAPSAGASYNGDKKFLEEMKAALVAERIVYVKQVEELEQEADALAQDSEPGDVQFDEESGEGATIAVERDLDLSLTAQGHAAIAEIDEALAALANGTFGLCHSCRRPIAKARLRALPYAELCIDCKSGGLHRR